MNFHKILLKIAYWLVAISIVILIGFTFYARHIINSQSQDTAAEATETEETTSIKFSGMSLTIDNDKAKKEVSEIKEEIKQDEGGKVDE